MWEGEVGLSTFVIGVGLFIEHGCLAVQVSIVRIIFCGTGRTELQLGSIIICSINIRPLTGIFLARVPERCQYHAGFESYCIGRGSRPFHYWYWGFGQKCYSNVKTQAEDEKTHRLGPCLIMSCNRFVVVKAAVPVACCCWFRIRGLMSLERASVNALSKGMELLHCLNGYTAGLSEPNLKRPSRLQRYLNDGV